LLQHIFADTRAFGGEGKIQLTGDGIRCGTDGRQQPVERVAAMLDPLEVAFPLQHLDLALEEIDGVPQHALQCAGPSLPYQRVRIFTRRQRGDPNADRVTKELVTGAKSGP